MLTLENISCSRSGNLLFKGLGYTIGEGSLLIIRGENGSGKTTLLETIAGLRKAQSGQVLYAKKNVYGNNYKEYCDIIQYIGHKNAIKPQLTVLENITFWAELKGNENAIAAAIAFFSLDDYKDRLCANLSAGYLKRIVLARLMVTNSEIWLLDEPFINLDHDGINSLAALITSRCENGGSVIMTVHGDLPFENYSEINLNEFI